VSDFATPSIDWAGLSPYLIALFGTAVILLTSVFLRTSMRRGFASAGAAITLLGSLAATLTLYALDRTASGLVAEAIQRDDLAHLTQAILFGTAILAVMVAHRERTSDEHAGEFYGLLVAAVAGMAFLAASSNLMTLFLGLEWFSICLYLLTSIATDRVRSLEAGLKYLVIGSFASAVLLFGLALVYGATGTINFTEIGQTVEPDNLLLMTGLSMILIGLGFKVSAAPLHQWTPDVYEGAPTSVTGFMAAATKVAVFVLALRLLNTAFPEQAEFWTIVLAVLATISLAWGNLAALAQRDVKRILAYSSVSHAGFLLMPLAAGNALGGRALLFYLIPYAAMTVGAFAVVAARERELGRPVDLDALSGMGWERPFIGVAMAVFMLGFIGLPPSGLFLGKFYAFAALYDRGWVWLMVIGAVFTAVSVYYYLGVVRSMYMRDLPVGAPVVAGGSPPRDRLLVTAIGASLVIAVGTFFGVDPLVDVIRESTDFLTYPF
jgi:NADH-quinone oxidoreductase subunit N